MGGGASKNLTACSTIFQVAGAGAYPFAPLGVGLAAGAVDFNVQIKVSVPKKNVLTFELKGWHDAFPDYEWLIQVGSKKFSGYQYSSPAKGPGIGSGSLGPGGNVVIKSAGLSVLNVKTTPPGCPCE